MKVKESLRISKVNDDIYYSCTVYFLDNSEPLTISYQREIKGIWLIDYVSKELNLLEKDYFSLRYVDKDEQRHWIDPTESIYQQLKNVSPKALYFRVKFYPSEIEQLKEDITKYFLFLQLRRDFLQGRLICNNECSTLLTAYLIQSEFGKYNSKASSFRYMEGFKSLPRQLLLQKDTISQLHESLLDLNSPQAQSKFLKAASELDTYGVDPHPVKDQKNNSIYIGITHLGILIFHDNERTHLFKWHQVNKIAFEGKMLFVHVTVGENLQPNLHYKTNKHICGFKCLTLKACSHLWKCCIEQQCFFTLNQTIDAPRITSNGSRFMRGTKYTFKGPCQTEVVYNSSSIERDQPSFSRSFSNPQFVKKEHKLHIIERNCFSADDISSHCMETDGIDDIHKQDSVIDSDVANYYSSDTLKMDEILPKVPTTKAENHIENACSSQKLDFDNFVLGNPELDAQIGALEMELKMARAMNAINKPLNDISYGPAELKKEAYSLKKENNGCKKCVYSIVFLIGIILMTFLSVMFIVFETELELPVIIDIRSFPQIEQLKMTKYIPLKNLIKTRFNFSLQS